MAEFMLVYKGGKKPSSPEEGAAMMQRWNDWLKDMGDDMIDPGTPVGKSMTVSAEGVQDGGGAEPLMGFSVIRAEDMDAALEKAKACPFVEMGKIEVAQMMQMG